MYYIYIYCVYISYSFVKYLGKYIIIHTKTYIYIYMNVEIVLNDL